MHDLEQKRREDARWKMLRIANAARPIGISEAIIGRVLADVAIPFSRTELRAEIAYLRDLGFIGVKDADEEWIVRLTAAGVDLVEYAVPAPAGIARPRKSTGAA